VIKQEQKINTILRIQQEEVAKLSNQYDLQVALGNFISTKNDTSREELKVILQNKKIETPTIQFAELTTLDGSMIASSTIGDTKETSSVPVAVSSGETSIEVRKDPADGFAKLYMTTLINVNKQRAGVLTLVFRTDDIIAAVQDYTGLDATGETVVVAKDAISLFPLRFDTDATLKTNLSSLDLYANTTSNGTYREAVDYRGKQVLVVAHQIGLTNWIVATKIDKDEALASIVALRNGMIVIVLMVSLLIVVIALFFTRVFTRPILLISRVSERIGKGDFAAQVQTTRRDELGTLAHSVNVMGANLRDMVGNIESQRQRVQIILDTTTEGIFALDDDATIIIANRAGAGLLQAEPTQLIGKNMHDAFELRYGLQAFTIDYAVDGVHTYSHLQYKDTTGQERYVKVIVARVHGPARPGVARVIVTIHDETSSHDLENMKTDFVSMAAHELRTPLTAVRGYLEMMQYKQQHNDTVDMPTYVRRALKNVTDLGGLINNLLDVTRIERGTLTLNLEKVDIAADVSQAVDDLRFIADDHQVALSFDGPRQGEYIVADSIALREIINNLLSNALKYTQEGDRIDVTLRRTGDMYDVSIADTGIGIAKEAQAHLFTKFYRVHGGLDSGSTGTGLGLYIAKSIVERFRGTIEVESTEGKGSTFTCHLPVYSDAWLASSQSDKEMTSTTVRRKRGWVTKNITR
jgi:two-component system phosphate regulon sensor histidine kinase PhoR